MLFAIALHVRVDRYHFWPYFALESFERCAVEVGSSENFAMASQCITTDHAIDLIFASDYSNGPAVSLPPSIDDFSFSLEEDDLSSLSEGSFENDNRSGKSSASNSDGKYSGSDS